MSEITDKAATELAAAFKAHQPNTETITRRGFNHHKRVCAACGHELPWSTAEVPDALAEHHAVVALGVLAERGTNES